MAVFLIECSEDEKRQVDFPNEEASLSVLEMMAGLTDGAILILFEPVTF